MAVFHYDVDRAYSLQSIAVEHRISIYGAGDLEAQAVVEGRKREHLDLVGHAGDTGNALDDTLDIGLLERLVHRAGKFDLSGVGDAEADIIPDAVVRIHPDFVKDLALDGYVGGFIGRPGDTSAHQERGREQPVENSGFHLLTPSTYINAREGASDCKRLVNAYQGQEADGPD